MMTEYRPRIADRILERKLKGKGAVLLEGAKWCGETTTAEQICRSDGVHVVPIGTLKN